MVVVRVMVVSLGVRCLAAAAIAEAHVDVHPLAGDRAAHPEANLPVGARVVFAPVVAEHLDEVLEHTLPVPDEALLAATRVAVWLSQVTTPPSLLLRRLVSCEVVDDQVAGSTAPGVDRHAGAQAHPPVQVKPAWQWVRSRCSWWRRRWPRRRTGCRRGWWPPGRCPGRCRCAAPVSTLPAQLDGRAADGAGWGAAGRRPCRRTGRWCRRCWRWSARTGCAGSVPAGGRRADAHRARQVAGVAGLGAGAVAADAVDAVAGRAVGRLACRPCPGRAWAGTRWIRRRTRSGTGRR